jgi:hypothetical protein
VLLWLFVRHELGGAWALLLLALTATDPVFVSHARLDWGPQVIAAFLRVLALIALWRWIQTSSSIRPHSHAYATWRLARVSTAESASVAAPSPWRVRIAFTPTRTNTGRASSTAGPTICGTRTTARARCMNGWWAPDEIRYAIEYVENNPIKAGYKPQHWKFMTPYR